MAINKIVYDGNTLIDLTSDTVTAGDLAEGVTAHDRSGTLITGTAVTGDYILTYDENTTVGRAKVGTAKTGTPNYTPSGDVVVTTETLTVVTGARLTDDITGGYVLTLGVELTTKSKDFINSVAFNGNGVHFTIERET